MHRKTLPSSDHFFLSSSLRKWFLTHKRSFPWRNCTTPYAVWIAEVMLQQTRSNVVIRYFEQWLQRFPNVASLAAASPEEILKAWEGLGYYSRARHLHEAAKTMVREHDGTVPQTRKALQSIKGLGPYTIGAILSFAFHQKAAAIDGNALRVLVRYFVIEEDVSKSAVHKKIWALAEAILPEQEPWVVVEALIELGATVCMQIPKCFSCPLRTQCGALQQGKIQALPKKKKKPKIQQLQRHVVVVHSGDAFLLKKGEKGKVMADLYEFLYYEHPITIELLLHSLSLSCTWERELSTQVHAFTRFRVTLIPSLWATDIQIPINGCTWISKKHLQALPFSSGHKKVMMELY